MLLFSRESMQHEFTLPQKVKFYHQMQIFYELGKSAGS